jgi:transposase
MSDKYRIRTQIQFLSQHGVKSKTIAERLNLNIKTVHKWMGREHIIDLPHPGRPPLMLSDNTRDKIEELCRDKWNASIRKTAHTLNASTDYQVREKVISKSTVCSFIRSTDWGRIAYRAQTAPMLTEKNVRDRLAFAHMVQDAGYCDGDEHADELLQHLLFSDESVIELYPKPNSQNTRIRTTNRELRSPVRIPKNGLKIMIAGGMAANGLTELHICDQRTTVNGEYYRQRILPTYFTATTRDGDSDVIDQRRLFSDSHLVVFIQDGAPAHTAALTLTELQGQFSSVWSKSVWPGNSPDLNPIEHVWNELQQSVFCEPYPRNRDELVSRVQDAWSSLTIEYTWRLIHSFPNRIKQCLDRHGNSTDY